MKQTFLYGAMALGLLFTSCSSDKLSELSPNNEPLDADQTFYVSLKISGDATGTRASNETGGPSLGNADGSEDFSDGIELENQVSGAYFVFYDENGNVVGDVVPVDLPEASENPEGETVEKTYKEVVSVVVRKGEKKPSQVICYINPIQSGSLNVNLNTIQTVSRSQCFTGTGTNRYFAMSNSVYYPEGEAEGSLPQIAVKIPSNQLYTTEKDANDALDLNNCVEIYVERYATKLKFQAAAPDAYQTAMRVYNTNATTYSISPVTLTFTPQYWAVNAEANRTYVIKSFRQESSDGLILGSNYTYDGLNQVINVNNLSNAFGATNILNQQNYWDWNNPDFKRSYWGMSPAYFTEEYPEVSSDVMGDNALPVNQKYITYNELVNHSNNIGFAANNTTPQYFRETTVGSKALHANNPAAAVASVIYVGQYNISVNGTPAPDNSGFYTYLTGPVTLTSEGTSTQVDRPYVYFENNPDGSSKVNGGETMLKRFLAQATCFYKEVTNEDNEVSYERMTIANSDDYTTLVNALQVSEISDAVKTAYDGDNNTMLKLQANARTLQFKSLSAANNIYVLTGNGYNKVVENVTSGNNEITLTQANLAIMRQVGYAYYYTSGHAYFNIPVKHLGWYRKGNDQKTAEKIDWSKVRVGDFGMVRNHSYSISVESIKGLASGIGGDNVPIVPPATTDDYFVAYSVRILKWAVVPIQHVNL